MSKNQKKRSFPFEKNGRTLQAENINHHCGKCWSKERRTNKAKTPRSVTDEARVSFEIWFTNQGNLH